MSMEPVRAEIRAWLEAILAETKESPSALAKRAGVAETTLTRFLNSDSVGMLSPRTLAKVAHVTGHTAPGFPTASQPRERSGLSEIEAEPYTASDPENPLHAAISALIKGRKAADAWELHTRTIDAEGYVPGDVVIVDLGLKPQPGDIVCAQDYKWSEGKAETIFRVFEPPYLMVATVDPQLAKKHRKPLLVDDDRVIIKGVVTDLVRRSRR